MSGASTCGVTFQLDDCIYLLPLVVAAFRLCMPGIPSSLPLSTRSIVHCTTWYPDSSMHRFRKKHRGCALASGRNWCFYQRLVPKNFVSEKQQDVSALWFSGRASLVLNGSTASRALGRENVRPTEEYSHVLWFWSRSLVEIVCRYSFLEYMAGIEISGIFCAYF